MFAQRRRRGSKPWQQGFPGRIPRTAEMKHYFYVRWAENLRMEMAQNIEEACRLAYGMVADNMQVKDIGTKHPKYLSHKKKQELQNNPDGWVSPDPRK